MKHVYVVGQMTIKNQDKWIEYRSQVLATLIPWEGELVLRGSQIKTFSGQCTHPEIVVVRFPSLEQSESWHASPAYQALIPLRSEAADVVLITYEA